MIKIDQKLFSELMATRRQLERLGVKIDHISNISNDTDFVLHFDNNNFEFFLLERVPDETPEAILDRIKRGDEQSDYEADLLIDFHNWKKAKKVRYFKPKTIKEWSYQFDGIDGINIVNLQDGYVTRCHVKEFKRFYKDNVRSKKNNLKSKSNDLSREELLIAKQIGITVEMIALYIFKRLNNVCQQGSHS